MPSTATLTPTRRDRSVTAARRSVLLSGATPDLGRRRRVAVVELGEEPVGTVRAHVRPVGRHGVGVPVEIALVALVVGPGALDEQEPVTAAGREVAVDRRAVADGGRVGIRRREVDPEDPGAGQQRRGVLVDDPRAQLLLGAAARDDVEHVEGSPTPSDRLDRTRHPVRLMAANSGM